VSRAIARARRAGAGPAAGRPLAGSPVRRVAGPVLGLLLGWSAAPLGAHEYWLDPVDATPDANGILFAHVRNGEEFAGTSFPYDPRRMERLLLVGPGGTAPIAARLGDIPAVQASLGRAGHYLVVLDTYGKELVYDDLAGFEAFLVYHGLERHLDEHVARDLPDVGIREIYFRHVKTLARAGDTEPDAAALSEGVSAAQGQALELVPENDPYVDGRIDVVLLADGEPLADAQVELFERTPDGAVSRTVASSDGEGRASFDVARAGDYLLNAVQVHEPGPEALVLEGPTPHWESRWASLTFERR